MCLLIWGSEKLYVFLNNSKDTPIHLILKSIYKKKHRRQQVNKSLAVWKI